MGLTPSPSIHSGPGKLKRWREMLRYRTGNRHGQRHRDREGEEKESGVYKGERGREVRAMKRK